MRNNLKLSVVLVEQELADCVPSVRAAARVCNLGEEKKETMGKREKKGLQSFWLTRMACAFIEEGQKVGFSTGPQGLNRKKSEEEGSVDTVWLGSHTPGTTSHASPLQLTHAAANASTDTSASSVKEVIDLTRKRCAP